MIWMALAAASVLDDPDFRFCHENGAFKGNEALCPLLQEVPPGTCPGLEAFCADPAAAPPVGCQSSNASGGGLGRSTSDTVESPTTWDSPTGCSNDTPSAGPSLLSWFIAFVVAFLVGGLAIGLLSFLGLRTQPKARRVRPTSRSPEDEGPAFSDVVDDVPDLPSEDLLTAAREALDSGDLGLSVTLARGAVLRQLGETGELRLHRARTDREYVRQVSGETRDALDDVLSASEQHRWGRIPLTGTRVDEALRSAARLVGIAMLLLLCLPALGSDRLGPSGDVGLFRLLQGEGYDVRFHHGPVATIDADVAGMLLDRTVVSLSEDDWQHLLAWAADGHVLIVAGDVSELGEREEVSEPCVRPGRAVPVLPDGSLGYRSQFGDCEVSWLVMRTWEEGLIVGVADPFLLWNGALMVDANRQVWLDLVAELRGVGWIDGTVELATWGVSASDTPPSRALANLALLPFVLHVLLMWALVAWWRGQRFGRTSGPETVPERSFAEHALAVASHYRRLDDRAHAAQSLARWAAVRSTSGLVQDALRAGYATAEAQAWAERVNAVAAGAAADDDFLEELCKLTRT